MLARAAKTSWPKGLNFFEGFFKGTLGVKKTKQIQKIYF